MSPATPSSPLSSLSPLAPQPSDLTRRAAIGRIALGLWAAGAVGSVGVPSHLHAASDAPRVGEPGVLPEDVRLGALKDLDGFFPFDPPATKDAWAARRADVRRRLLVANGLWPMPARGPIDATVHGRVERDGYTVDRVFFESSPGLYVTGSLYRPAGKSGRLPAVLCPHGHFANGRFHDHGEAGIERELAVGSEKFRAGGRHPLQARCVGLARLGCVVFHYDMLGYADSAPITSIAHGFRDQRPELSSPDRFGLFSAQAELRLLSAMGLQTWNSIRALDWVASLPYVDASRVAVTGASGGGTQTFILCAIDDRPAVAFPAVMVSTAMQGGCTCENASYLRIDTGNVEIAGLVAPKPLGMTFANDWTREMPEKGVPALEKLYALLGAPENVRGRYFDFDHGYNAPMRAMLYEFMNEHLRLGHETPIEEKDYVPLSREELTVWTADHPKPECDDDAEVAVLRWFDQDIRGQIDALVPKDENGLERWREVVGGGVATMIGRGLPAGSDVHLEERSRTTLDGGLLRIAGYLETRSRGESRPILIHYPVEWTGGFALWVDEAGKSGLYRDGKHRPGARALLESGLAVIGLDLLYQGEFLRDGESHKEARFIENGRAFAGYTYGYNHPLCAARVHDVLAAISWARSRSAPAHELRVVGSGRAAAWAALACALSRDAVTGAVLDTRGFRFGAITAIRDPDLLPGAVRYGDIPGILSLIAPVPLFLAGEGTKTPDIVAACYRAAGASERLRTTGDARDIDDLVERALG